MVVKIRPAIIFSILFVLAAPSWGASPKEIDFQDKAVTKYVLDNGLIILVQPSPPKGLVSIDINVRAGASLEGEYLGSGISHFVEHMIFKGTKSRKAGAIEEEIKSYGGFMNGGVTQDLTNYHVTVSSAYLKAVLGLLKEMLSNATFDEKELEKERAVILKEINLDKDDPERQLVKLLNETAYTTHPYKYPPIGYRDLFLSLKRDDLVRYYARMYLPNRMVIAITGDTKGAAALVEREFKDLKKPNYKIEGLSEMEPLQMGERDRSEEAEINLSYLAMGFHSTSVLSRDLFSMDVLSMILGRGDNSRLNRSLLKEKRLVYSISSWNYTPKDPGLFVIKALLDKDNLVKAESSILEEIDKLKTGSIDDEEVDVAKRMVLSDFIFSRQTIEAAASDLSQNEILTGNYDFSRLYVSGVQGVTKDDIKRVAGLYLERNNLTVIKLMPQGLGATEESADDKTTKKDAMTMDTLPNGVRLVVHEDDKTPTVSITAAFLGGLLAEDKANNGISNLTARMLLKGTSQRKEDEIKGAIERLGGEISSFSGFNGFGLNISILKDDLDFALSLVRDVLTNSIFPAEELDREKALILAQIKDEDDNIFTRGSNALRSEIFEGSAYSLRPIGEDSSIRSLRREDLMEFYNSYCVSANVVIAVSGDLEKGTAMAKMREAFKDMKPKAIPNLRTGRTKEVGIKTKEFEMEKEESLVLLGFETVDNKNPDRYALDVLSSTLSGYSGRLFFELRNKLSLAYTLGCINKQLIDTGYFVFYVGTVKEKVAEAKKALLGQIKAISAYGISDKELTLAKRELLTDYRLAKQTNQFYSSNSALDELYGVGYDDIYKYESEIGKVTKEDVLRVANKYLALNAYAEVIVYSK